MADIRFPAFRARFRRAGGNARVFGQLRKRNVGNGVLQKESEKLPRRRELERGLGLLPD